MLPKVIRNDDSDLQAKIKAEVDAALERTFHSEIFMKSLASTLTDIVAKKLEESWPSMKILFYPCRKN